MINKDDCDDYFEDIGVKNNLDDNDDAWVQGANGVYQQLHNIKLQALSAQDILIERFEQD